MTFYTFFRKNTRLLLFGVLLTFFAGFGQTFMFSLFLPAWQETFGLSSGSFGTFYSAITLTSALLLPYTGGLLDRVPLQKYTFAVLGVMLVSALLLSFAHTLIVLFLAILGVRHTGQGLMGHISQTTMARRFDADRGKALSVSSVGFSLGEAVLPVSVALLIGAIGWRSSWMLIAGFVLLCAALIIPLLLKNYNETAPEPERFGAAIDAGSDPETHPPKEKTSPETNRSWTRAEMLRDPRFYFILPAGLASPILLTGFFLYQLPLAESKGWSMAWMASCFIGFAGAKMVFSLGIGPVIDRFTARAVYPFMLIPMVVGFVVLLLGSHPVTALIYMLLLGATEGISGNTKTALFAEIYGVTHLGAIRSTLVTLMVFSTASAPVLFGNLLDAGVVFSTIILGAIAFVLLSMLLALRITPWAEAIWGS
ncbi:putative arabinose efflux permease, MFS family [Cyclonatronum proteinivorum]|uniref:Putative arabinose efflux permease, MFS family n=1 Tax=Cyclonatronum proteinivorum TaxID=1457365 RepID=A0A345UHA0_9BACT|nr:MFS transporter [Cyclonatronum proteinivorum]AXI99851.1 putative arabinose efflux permease, MFS family [Cyclonatronum proteinivorum]